MTMHENADKRYRTAYSFSIIIIAKEYALEYYIDSLPKYRVVTDDYLELGYTVRTYVMHMWLHILIGASSSHQP